MLKAASLASLHATAASSWLRPMHKKLSMARRKNGKGSRSLPNPEAYQRINFLLHLSQQIILTAHKQMAQSQPEGTRLTPAFLKANLAQELALSQLYNKTLRDVARKAVVRLAPSVKRYICKKCDSSLLPSITCTVRTRRCKTQNWTVIRCICCGSVQKFLIPELAKECETTDALNTRAQS